MSSPSAIGPIIYPVKDLARAKRLYGKLPGVEPYTDEVYYVGFRIGDLEIGPDPNGHSKGMTGSVSHWNVDDTKESLKVLLDADAWTQQAITDVDGAELIATAKDADATPSHSSSRPDHLRSRRGGQLAMVAVGLKSHPCCHLDTFEFLDPSCI